MARVKMAVVESEKRREGRKIMALGVTCTSIENLTNSFDISIPIYRRYSFIDYSRIREFPSIGIFTNQCLRINAENSIPFEKSAENARLSPTTLYSNKPSKRKDLFEWLEKRDLDRLKLVDFPMICSCGKKRIGPSRRSFSLYEPTKNNQTIVEWSLFRCRTNRCTFNHFPAPFFMSEYSYARVYA